MKHPLIETKELSKYFSGNIIFERVNLSVDQGKSLTIIGGSGQGKSVLVKCITGLVKPDEGIVLFDGSPLNGKHKEKFINNLGILFQGAALFDSLPVWENISFKFKYTGTHSVEERRRLASEKLDLVGLGPNELDLFPAELSGGMQKRVGIARAIATNPKVIFFDEPTSGLDPVTGHTINKLIRQIINELAATTITITHDLNTVRSVSDEVVLLNKGRIDWTGTIATFENSDNTNIREFISPGNI